MDALTRQDMMAFLEEKGCRVIGTTEEFNGSEGGIWLSGEGSDLFDYYGFFDTLGVKPSLDSMTNKRGWFFEWYDAGTMMCWPD